mmetsp:Transcript_44630/g.92978  ORF Transcript_44630/g.92978 Transcript_44630/m.92978 type:complete len:366 (-) Transcript_44630:261-1358(-)
MGRKPFVGGNWKCNGTIASGTELAETLKNGSVMYKNAVEVVICPVAPQINMLSKIFKRSPLNVGAQNFSKDAEGAFTGEITASMLKDVGVNWSLIGHSERRTKYGETDEVCAAKVEKAQEAKLSIIFCIGELLEEREKGETDAVNKRMMDAVIPKITDWSKVVIAYEPVWAIGTGKVATPDQAQEAHAAIRKMLPEASAEKVRILYGGSVTTDNCKELIGKEDIDGFLVGGASLKPTFTDIITACVPVKPLTKPEFRKVSSIEPEQRGVNFYGKVLKAPESVGEDASTVEVGDETAKVTLRVRGDRSSACEVGKVMRVQNAKVIMVKGFIQVQIDKWAALKPAEEEIGEVGKKDISAVEYELTSS